MKELVRKEMTPPLLDGLVKTYERRINSAPGGLGLEIKDIRSHGEAALKKLGKEILQDDRLPPREAAKLLTLLEEKKKLYRKNFFMMKRD